VKNEVAAADPVDQVHAGRSEGGVPVAAHIVKDPRS